MEGAFAHIALKALFPHAEAVSYSTWDEVFEAVASGEAAHGVVPFENSHAGDVSAVLDLCYNHPELWVVDVYDLPIYPITKLEHYCKLHKVLMGIITVPASAAQDVANMLIAGGVKAIWNFAPTHLDVPDNILVQNENMATSLAVLSVHLRAAIKEEKK